MAGIDDYLSVCYEEDEASDRAAQKADAELNRQSHQISLEAEYRRRQRVASQLPRNLRPYLPDLPPAR
jgi:hypothetical protein